MFLGLLFGAAFSPVTAVVLAAVAGGSAWFLARQLLPVDRRAGLDVGELLERGRGQADGFARLAKEIRDAELRRRVDHVATRLREMFAELERKPQKAGEAESFVEDFLPRALAMVEHYVSLSARIEGGDERLAAAAHTVNTIADAVRATHRRLFEDELVEFVAASRSLDEEIRLMHPTLARSPQEKVR